MGVIGKVFKAWEIAAGFGGFGYSQFIAPGFATEIFLFFQIFRIMGLAEKPREIFEFKGLICKIFRGKDLVRSYCPIGRWWPSGGTRRSTNFKLYLYFISSDLPTPTRFATLFSMAIHRLTGKLARMGA
jgi:hypothetical protein